MLLAALVLAPGAPSRNQGTCCEGGLELGCCHTGGCCGANPLGCCAIPLAVSTSGAAPAPHPPPPPPKLDTCDDMELTFPPTVANKIANPACSAPDDDAHSLCLIKALCGIGHCPLEVPGKWTLREGDIKHDESARLACSFLDIGPEGCPVQTRAEVVLRGAMHGTGTCCNQFRVLDKWTGKMRLQCSYGVGLWPFVLVAAMLGCAGVLAITRGRRRWDQIRQREEEIEKEENERRVELHADSGQTLESKKAAARQKEKADPVGESTKFAREILKVTETDKSVRDGIFDAMRDVFGFQQHSVDNQREHLDSLLLSYASQIDLAGVDERRRAQYLHDEAVNKLHTKLIAPIERWRSHVLGEKKQLGSLMSLRTHQVGGGEPRERERRDGRTAAGVVTDGGPLSSWVTISTEQQLEEITLLLLVWGEAANVRFMPELLYFIFEVFRAHFNATDMRKDSGPSAAAAPSYSGGFFGLFRSDLLKESDAGKDAKFAFLNNVIKPIYVAITTARSRLDQHSHDKENYDDFNESFWQAEGSIDELHTLPLKKGGGVHKVLDQPPGRERYQALLGADWNSFFDKRDVKTHREKLWWSNLLAANRRVFLLHILSLALLVFIELGKGESSLQANGWSWARLLPLTLLLAPATTAFASWYEVWVVNSKGRDDKRGVMERGRRDTSACLLLILLPLVGCIVYVQAKYSLEEFEQERLSNINSILLISASSALMVLGVPALLKVFKPIPASFTQLDGKLFFETRTADIKVKDCIPSRGGASLLLPWRWRRIIPNREVRDVVAMWVFWIGVWSVKLIFAGWVLVPALVSAHSDLTNAKSFAEVSPKDNPVPDSIMIFLNPKIVCRVMMQLFLWATGCTIFIADTLMWYQLGIAAWALPFGLVKHGLGQTGKTWTSDNVRKMRANAREKVLPLSLMKESTFEAALRDLWGKFVLDLYTNFFISAAERDRLIESITAKGYASVEIANREAQRRLHFFARSMGFTECPESPGVVKSLAMSTLVPIFEEPILMKLPSRSDKLLNGKGGEPFNYESKMQAGKMTNGGWSNFDMEGVSDGGMKKMVGEFFFNKSHFANEWKNFKDYNRLGANVVSNGDGTSPVEKWHSQRTQSVYRTLKGMMKNRAAIKCLLEHQTRLDEGERKRLLDSKYRLVAATQKYGSYAPHQYDVAHILTQEAEFKTGGGVVFAYIDDRKGTYYSCLIDPAKTLERVKDEEGRDTPKLKPSFDIRLPGQPILSNGKPDNQNNGLIFTRGSIIQTIDCNQEGYLEESFKICNALREFCLPAAGGGPPAIVGFREHIFSSLGTLGEFGASAEHVFGTIVQRTLSYPLWARYHYGHPDMLDKLAMMAQGGLSKATKTLNLSEDIFGGIDATLRGHTILHREYFQVGKGRDMGCNSIVGFFSKLSGGTAQMTTSRQAFRLGQRLGLWRLMAFYQTHIGYYLGQLHLYHAAYLQLALAFLGLVAEGTGFLPGAGEPCLRVFNKLFSWISALFFLMNLFPSFVAVLTDEGLYTAVTRPFAQIFKFSPVFFAINSRCIAHNFSQEFVVSDASYKATGRGLALQHDPFHQLYVSFAISCVYPGVELLGLILAIYLVLPPHMELNPWSVGFALIQPVSLTFGILLFNCEALKSERLREDFGAWLHWFVYRIPEKELEVDLTKETKLVVEGGVQKKKEKERHDFNDVKKVQQQGAIKSYAEFHARKQDSKGEVKWGALVLPSKELIMSLLLLLITSVAMAPYNWGGLQLALLAMPILSATAIALTVVPLALLWSCCSSCQPLARTTWPLEIVAAVVCAAVLVVESTHWPALDARGFASMPRDLPRAHLVLLLGTRYYSFRWTCNVLMYTASFVGWSSYEQQLQVKLNEKTKLNDRLGFVKRLPLDVKKLLGSKSFASVKDKIPYQLRANFAGGWAADCGDAGFWYSILILPVGYVVSMTAFAHMMLLDFVIGLVLQLPYFVVAVIPGSTPLHFKQLMGIDAAKYYTALGKDYQNTTGQLCSSLWRFVCGGPPPPRPGRRDQV